MNKIKKVVDYLKQENQISFFQLMSRFGEAGFNKLTDFQQYQALVNIRQPFELPQEILQLQDEFLQEISKEKGIVKSENFQYSNNIALWQGDITRLKIDAIVNAANSALLGCFYPLHACIDNIIQTYAGVQLRLACHEIMEKQALDGISHEPTGLAKITPAFNLPSKYVLHTVGPIITQKVSENDKELLASCYNSCLKLADENKLESIAFCCISTGEFCFPQELAAEIALTTVENYLKTNNSSIKVVFNVFKDDDRKIYERLLG